MKKLLLTIGLVSVAGSLAFGQGTVYFSNTAFQKVSSGTEGTAASTWTVIPLTAGAINFGVFYGIGQSTSLTFMSTLGVNSTSQAGVIATSVDNKSPITALQIPGTSPNEADVWLRVAAWSGSYGTDWAGAKAASLLGTAFFGQTDVRNVPALGPSTGPGGAIWQTATGTDPKKFAGGFAVFTGGVIPEPTTITLAGLGAAALLIFRRRK